MKLLERFVRSLLLLIVLVALTGSPVLSKDPGTSHYQDNGDGTVTDVKTGLTWMRCSIGQQWTGSECAGEALLLDWEEACNIGKDFNYAGLDDWQLPSKSELKTLVLCSSGEQEDTDARGENSRCPIDSDSPAVNQATFPETPRDWYWSSSPNPEFAWDAWGIDFSDGEVLAYGKYNKSRARLVRKGME